MRTDDDNTLYQLVSTNPITWQSVGQDSVTAEKWANPITLQLKGMATSDAVSLDGSKDIDINVTGIKANDIDDTFFANLFKRFADKAFPVGFIWESTDATNPANILGVGTWESYGQGRVLVGAGQGSGLSNYTAGSTGGEEKHKLTTDELPAHNHSASISSTNISGSFSSGLGTDQSPSVSGVISAISSGWWRAKADSSSNILNGFKLNSNHTHQATIGSVGKNQSHENRQPYVVVYRFRRID